MTIKIEKNIPIPAVPTQDGGAPTYPWREMEVGDSFLVVGSKTNSITRAAYEAQKRIGFVFSCRTIQDGIRVWRVK